MVRADAKNPQKNRPELPVVKRTIFVCENFDFWGLGGQVVRNSPFEGDFAFMFFLFLFFSGAQNLILWEPQMPHVFPQHFKKTKKLFFEPSRSVKNPLKASLCFFIFMFFLTFLFISSFI